MSNLSVLERLEALLSEYGRDEVSREEFVRFLRSSVEALEGVPYSVLIDLRTHERNIEMEGYFDEEGFESRAMDAKAVLSEWLNSLKASYGACDC
jgi:hypothetical protein